MTKHTIEFYSYMSHFFLLLLKPIGNGARGHYNLTWALTSFIIWVLVLLAIHLCKMGPIAYLYVANEIPCAAIPGPECKRLGLGFWDQILLTFGPIRQRKEKGLAKPFDKTQNYLQFHLVPYGNCTIPSEHPHSIQLLAETLTPTAKPVKIIIIIN